MARAKARYGLSLRSNAVRSRRKIVADNNRRRSGSLRSSRVFRIGDESNLPGNGFFDAGDARDVLIGIAVFQCRSQGRCDGGEFHNC